MEASVIQYITDHDMIKTGDRIGVAVSGGEDSMALLTLLNNLAQQLDFSVLAIHVNHNIRKSANRDARFVKKYCDENGIEFIKYSVDAPEYSTANKVGLEANPQNFLLMHAMGPNVSGVIGSAVAAGVLLALCG